MWVVAANPNLAPFRLKAFIGMWVLDAQGRRKLCMRGDLNNTISCGSCRLRSCWLILDGVYPEAGKHLWKRETIRAGYVCHVSRIVTGAPNELVTVGMKSLHVTRSTMLQQSPLVSNGVTL